MKRDMKIEMTGAQYIEYKKYLDSKNKEFNKFLSDLTKTKSFKVSMWILLSLIVFIAIIDSLTPHQSVGFNWTWNGVLMFLSVCMGLSWLIHGFGFILVRR